MRTRRSNSKPEQAKPETAESAFPSARYFQVHFEFLHESINDLKQQLNKANQQIADLQHKLEADPLRDLKLRGGYNTDSAAGNNRHQS